MVVVAGRGNPMCVVVIHTKAVGVVNTQGVIHKAKRWGWKGRVNV